MSESSGKQAGSSGRPSQAASTELSLSTTSCQLHACTTKQHRLTRNNRPLHALFIPFNANLPVPSPSSANATMKRLYATHASSASSLAPMGWTRPTTVLSPSPGNTEPQNDYKAVLQVGAVLPALCMEMEMHE
eukprot:scaffold1784_cov21-Tisochrysis_lutea.AAC.1